MQDCDIRLCLWEDLDNESTYVKGNVQVMKWS